jgi:exosortase
MSDPARNEPSHQSAALPPGEDRAVLRWVGVGLAAAIIAWFFGIFEAYGPQRLQSTLGILVSAWNPETDYEHGFLFPVIISGLLIYRWKDLRAAAGKGDPLGLVPLVIGAVLFAAAYRVIQWRVAVVALPFVVWGAVWFLWGRKVAKITVFPLFFFLLSIPLPNFQQATVPLQILSTHLAQWGATLCGVETYVQGTSIYSAHENWEPLSIAGGCSGIRSLMALLMISAAWAYIAKVSLWKKTLLFFSAIPVAIIGNALRLTSIFVIAEYGNSEWARTTWHDWSGLLLFYPFSLALLLGFHSLLEGGWPWGRNRRTVRKVVVARPTTPNS